MKRAELYSQLAQLTDAQLAQLFALAQVVGTVPTESKPVVASKSDKALVQTDKYVGLLDPKHVVVSKPKKFSAKSLRCTKGIPSKVWSAIHHNVVENGGTWDRQKKVWTFKTIKACETVYNTQLKFAQAKGVEMPIETC